MGTVASLAPGAARAAQPLQDGPGNNTTDAAIAYNSDDDQYMVVYTTSFGRLEGQIWDADGTVIDSYLPMLWHASGIEYRNPRVTYRPADDQFVVAVVFEDSSVFIPTVRVSVSAYDTAGNLLWAQDVPGATSTTIRTPDVVADTFPNCCTLVTWKEGYGTIYAQQFDEDGGFIGPKTNVFVDGGRFSDHAFNPRLAYQRSPNDEFAVVYQMSDGGMPGAIKARTIQPISGSAGPVRQPGPMVANPRTSYGETFPGGPDIAYDEDSGRYLVAWRDEGGLWATWLDPDLFHASNHWQVFAESEAAENFLQPGIPEVTVADGKNKVLISHPRRLGGVFGPGVPAHWVHGWWLEPVSVAATQAWVSMAWQPEAVDNAVGAYSPVTETAFVAWDQEEVGPGFPPPARDIFFELAAPPP